MCCENGVFGSPQLVLWCYLIFLAMNLDVIVTVMNIINHSDKLKNQKAIDTNLTRR